MNHMRPDTCSICRMTISASDAWIMTETEVVHADCRERLRRLDRDDAPARGGDRRDRGSRRPETL